MASLNLADTFVTFLALLGPQKVLLSFAQIARTLDNRSLRLVAAATALTAAIVGTVCALTAPWLASFFHITSAALALSSGLVFFVYAVGLVLGVHFDHAEDPAEAIPDGEGAGGKGGGGGGGEADPSHPLRSGYRAMLLPFVVSPLAVAADLEESLSVGNWGARWVVAGAFALVVIVDALCAVAFAPLLRRTHESILEVLSRLLGVLLAAVGVQIFLYGLTSLGVLHSAH
jgi:small neutral amino acid transporter SnatA (MarC family)